MFGQVSENRAFDKRFSGGKTAKQQQNDSANVGSCPFSARPVVGCADPVFA